MQQAQDSLTATTSRKTWLGIGGVIGFNLLPLYGVFAWGWTSFELIFLYWFENLVIGVFTAGRMLLRRFDSSKQLFKTAFLALFFTAHFGGFCWAHGTFLFSMFGPDALQPLGLYEAAMTVIRENGLVLAALSLSLLQLMDWGWEVRENGIGAVSPNDLMARPYRRIVVLHVTIIAAGATLTALNEPLVGLLVLVLVKTASDVWHWRKGGNV
ncbi:MAG: DUF6498-containing protein [Pseudomonadales bacterium]